MFYSKNDYEKAESKNSEWKMHWLQYMLNDISDDAITGSTCNTIPTADEHNY